ncbi:MAG TPA: amidase [Myxococcota bacterium]|nr:amidase [Myxococcota bacterium]
MPPQTPSPLPTLDAVGHAELVRKGEATPRELVDAAIARIEKVNPELNAVIHPSFEKARAQASAPGLPHGPLRGVPLLMKDLGGQTAGDPYHAGMRFLRDAAWREVDDSHFAARLRAAGAVFLGRTNTPELGLLPTTEPAAYGATKNPWDLSRSAGGSSGGAAAAVASGMVPVAHASDGGGSIRIPASHCGLVGLKTTRGRSSFGPSLGERWGGLSIELVVSRSVRDTATLLDVVQGPMPGDPYAAAPPSRPYASEVGAPPGRLRIGLMSQGPRSIAVDSECTAAAQRAARLLEGLGHRIEESHPPALDEPDALKAFVTVVAVSVARALEIWGAKVGRPVLQDSVEPLTWALAEMARSWSSTRYLEAVESVHAFGRRLAAWWSRGFDLLLTPTTAEPAPLLGEMTSPPDAPLKGFLRAAPFGAFTSSFNMSGQPAVSLPLHWTRDGLPVGVQLVAAAGREDLLLRVASQLEAAAPWAHKRPPVSA